MIGIDMEKPKSCKECDFCELYGFTIYVCNRKEMPIPDTEKTPKFCPLTELPSENKDMSWEELVEKCKSEFTQKHFQYEENQFGYSQKHITKIIFLIEDENYPDEVGCISFREEGVVECGAYAPSEGFFKSKIKPYEMYQIIKSLVGDER